MSCLVYIVDFVGYIYRLGAHSYSAVQMIINIKGNYDMKKILTIGMVTALLSLGGCKLIKADGECIGLCFPICNNIGGPCPVG